MLVHRLRRWSNIKAALGKYIVFVGAWMAAMEPEAIRREGGGVVLGYLLMREEQSAFRDYLTLTGPP